MEDARNRPERSNQEVVVCSHRWIDPEAKMRTAPPSECVIRRYYGEYKKGSFKFKVGDDHHDCLLLAEVVGGDPPPLA